MEYFYCCSPSHWVIQLHMNKYKPKEYQGNSRKLKIKSRIVYEALLDKKDTILIIKIELESVLIENIIFLQKFVKFLSRENY